MPATMFQGNVHIAKPQIARVAKAMSSHAKASRSMAVRGARMPGASPSGWAGRSESDMDSSLRRDHRAAGCSLRDQDGPNRVLLLRATPQRRRLRGCRLRRCSVCGRGDRRRVVRGLGRQRREGRGSGIRLPAVGGVGGRRIGRDGRIRRSRRRSGRRRVSGIGVGRRRRVVGRRRRAGRIRVARIRGGRVIGRVGGGCARWTRPHQDR